MGKKTPQIRWRESDSAELQRVINNFNAKLYRLQNKDPSLTDYLPARVKKSEIMESINTRADFNRIVNSLQRFSKRGAETPIKSKRGAKFTQWERNEQMIGHRIKEAAKTRQRKAIEAQEVKSRGKGTGSKRSEMGSIKSNELKPKSVTPENMSQKEWDYFKKSVDNALNPLTNEFLKHNMRLNYIKGLRNAGFSEDIVSLVHEVDIDTFLQTVELDTEAQFDFIYEPIEFALKQDSLYQVWESALKESKGG